MDVDAQTLALTRCETEWRDAGGIPHAPAAQRRRVVSLVPSLTETFCAIGGRPRLVGCTAFCTHPEGLLKDPAVTKVGGTKSVMRDKLLALNPDLLLLNLEENTLEDIDYFKPRVECYINGTRTLEEGLATILELGALAGTLPSAALLYKNGLAAQQQIEARTAERLAGTVRPALFYAIWREPWMSINRDTFIHEMLTRCGARNVFSERPQRYPEVTLEDVRAAAPELVWLPSEPYIFKEKHRAEWLNLTGLPAAQTGRVELVDGELVCWFGVRQIAGMEYTFQRLWREPVST